MTDLSHQPVWRKARRSGGNGNCVEVATLSDWVMVRDSKDQAGPALAVTSEEWRMFIDSLR